MVKPKTDNLLEVLRRSGLVDRERLARVLAELKGPGGDQAVESTRVVERLVEEGLLTPWQRDNLLQGRYKGFFIKKYKLLDLLGAGGMSHVYLAEHTLMQRRVAIKVLPKNRVKDTSYLGRFHREARAAATLDHRNIVRAYDVDNEGDIHFIVMEYVEGSDLLTIVKNQGPLDYARAADYIRQAAEGLHHAHQAGLIHRDVKPANLLVDRQNVVKLLDLGLARFTEDDLASLTVAYDENVLGTADYLAPEQAVNSHGVDARADVYSLGCSFYFLLAGQAPFPDGTLPQRLMMHQKVPPPDIRLKRPDAPEDLLDICLRMMAKKPSARFQSAGEVADALAGWLRAHGHAMDTSTSGIGSATRPGTGSSATRLPASSTRLPASGTKLPQASGSSPSAAGSSRGLTRAAPLQPTAKGGSAASSGGSRLRQSSVPAGPDKGSTSAPGSEARKESGPAAGSDPAPQTPAAPATPASPAASPAPKLAQQAALPVARRFEAADPLAEIAAEADELIASSYATRKGVTEGDLALYRNRKKLPAWAWWAVAGGAVLALLLLVLAIVLSQ